MAVLGRRLANDLGHTALADLMAAALLAGALIEGRDRRPPGQRNRSPSLDLRRSGGRAARQRRPTQQFCRLPLARRRLLHLPAAATASAHLSPLPRSPFWFRYRSFPAPVGLVLRGALALLGQTWMAAIRMPPTAAYAPGPGRPSPWQSFGRASWRPFPIFASPPPAAGFRRPEPTTRCAPRCGRWRGRPSARASVAWGGRPIAGIPRPRP